MAKQSQVLLLDAILTPNGQKEYVSELRMFSFPAGWARLQSPLYHLQSCRMSEAARASIIVHVLLRIWLQESAVQPRFVQAVRRVFQLDLLSGASPIATIIQVFAAMALVNSIIMSRSMSSSDRRAMNDLILRSREGYQRLCEAACIASSSTRSRSVSLAPSRSPSPARTIPSRPNLSPLFCPTDDVQDEGESLPLGTVTTKKAVEYLAFRGQPNVHVALHHYDMAKEYAIPFNCNILIGEDKHRYVLPTISFASGLILQNEFIAKLEFI